MWIQSSLLLLLLTLLTSHTSSFSQRFLLKYGLVIPSSLPPTIINYNPYYKYMYWCARVKKKYVQKSNSSNASRGHVEVEDLLSIGSKFTFFILEKIMQLPNLNFLVFQKFNLADCFYFDVAKPPSFHNVVPQMHTPT